MPFSHIAIFSLDSFSFIISAQIMSVCLSLGLFHIYLCTQLTQGISLYYLIIYTILEFQSEVFPQNCNNVILLLRRKEFSLGFAS